MAKVKMASFFQSGRRGTQFTSWCWSTPTLNVETTCGAANVPLSVCTTISAGPLLSLPLSLPFPLPSLFGSLLFPSAE
jgi:hypothetical protein